MRKKVELHRSFIRAIRKKYRGMTEPSALFNPVNNFERGRFTGSGMDKKVNEAEPAGTVHEGEFVVSAPDVRNAGGPDQVNKAVENAVSSGPPPASQRPIESAGDPNLVKSAEFRRGGFAGEKPGYLFAGPVVSAFGIDFAKNAEEAASNAADTVIDTTKAAADAATDIIPTDTEDVNTPTTTITSGKIDTENVTGVKAKYDTSNVEIASAADKLGIEEGVVDGVARDPNLTEKSDTEARKVTPSEVAVPDEQDATVRAGEFETLQDDQITELQNIAAGEGTASKVIGDLARQKLAGQLGAGNLAAEQAAAQLGLTGGSLAAHRARSRRDNQLAQTGLEGTLAADAVNRAENAVMQLSGIAERGTQFEEMKRQFGSNFDMAKANFGLDKEKFEEFKAQFSDNFGLQVDQLNLAIDNSNEMRLQFKENMDMAWDKLAENMRQFDSGIALNMFLNDTKIGQWKADTLMLAGDYKGAAAVYKEQFGINVDFSLLETEQQEQQFGKGMSNFITDIDLIPNDLDVFDSDGFTTEGQNTDAMRDLARAWNAQHPDGEVDVNDPGSWNKNSKFSEWAQNTYESTVAHKSPYYSMVQAFGDDEMSNMILGVQTEDPTTGERVPKYTFNEETGQYVDGEGKEFEYAGQTGVEGVRAAYTNMLHTRAISTMPDGTFSVDLDNPIMEAFMTDTSEFGDSGKQLGRYADFIETGAVGNMSNDEVAEFFKDPQNVAELNESGNIVTSTSDDHSYAWESGTNYSAGQAEAKWIEKNPDVAQPAGTVIEYNGNYYLITDQAKTEDASREVSALGSYARSRVRTYGMALTGPNAGTETSIGTGSAKFDKQ